MDYIYSFPAKKVVRLNKPLAENRCAGMRMYHLSCAAIMYGDNEVRLLHTD